jgi:hypothetical protein
MKIMITGSGGVALHSRIMEIIHAMGIPDVEVVVDKPDLPKEADIIVNEFDAMVLARVLHDLTYEESIITGARKLSLMPQKAHKQACKSDKPKQKNHLNFIYDWRKKKKNSDRII